MIAAIAIGVAAVLSTKRKNNSNANQYANSYKHCDTRLRLRSRLTFEDQQQALADCATSANCGAKVLEDGATDIAKHCAKADGWQPYLEGVSHKACKRMMRHKANDELQEYCKVKHDVMNENYTPVPEEEENSAPEVEGTHEAVPAAKVHYESPPRSPLLYGGHPASAERTPSAEDSGRERKAAEERKAAKALEAAEKLWAAFARLREAKEIAQTGESKAEDTDAEAKAEVAEDTGTEAKAKTANPVGLEHLPDDLLGYILDKHKPFDTSPSQTRELEGLGNLRQSSKTLNGALGSRWRGQKRFVRYLRDKDIVKNMAELKKMPGFLEHLNDMKKDVLQYEAKLKELESINPAHPLLSQRW